MMNKMIFCIFAISALAGCESAGTGVIVTIPSLVIDCDTSKCSSVASGSYSMVANITSSGCAVDQIEDLPVVTGTTSVICTFGSGCTGTVSSWRDKNGNSTTEISSSTYSVCGWIDLDSSGLLKNSNDAFAESNELVTSATITLTDWGASNFRLPKKH